MTTFEAPGGLPDGESAEVAAVRSSDEGRKRDSRPGDRAMIGFERSGLLGMLLRAPVWLYRLGLGWLLGHRFLLLSHRGRRSGRIHRTILEVIHYDPRTRESVVVSGWGRRADWYRNIRSGPPIEVQTGRERYRPTFRELSPEENVPIVAGYMRRLPPFTRPIACRLGFDVRGSGEERRAHARHLLMIGFRPRPDTTAPEVADPSTLRSALDIGGRIPRAR